MPDTAEYMVMGYAAAALIFAVTIGSIWWRYLRAVKDEQFIRELEQEEQDNKSTGRTPPLYKERASVTSPD